MMAKRIHAENMGFNLGENKVGGLEIIKIIESSLQ